MALAQQTPLLLLDEPTTYLDIAHQIDILGLCATLHQEQGRTLVAVLHDLNHAARYATHLIVMRGGVVFAEGRPADIVDATLVEEVFGLPCRVIDDPETGTPLVIPAARRPVGAAVSAAVSGAGAVSSAGGPGHPGGAGPRRPDRPRAVPAGPAAGASARHG